MVHESQKLLHLIYGNIEEELPLDMPIPSGKIVQTSLFFDANLYHDLVMGCTMIGILHLMNQTPTDWYCKKQATVAMATYSLEFVTIQCMTDQIIDLCYTLHMMGVPLDYHSYAFRDKSTIIQQSNIPESKLMKHWNVVAFHHVREAVTSGFLQLYHIPRNESPTDMLT